MRFAVALLLLVSPFAGAEEPKSWKGELVLPRKPAKEMTFQDRPKGEKTEKFELTGRYQVVPDDDVESWLKIKDGKNEGWTPKEEWVLVGEAFEYFDKLVKDDTKSTFPLRMRGICWQKREKYEKAIDDFNDCLRLDPADRAAYNLRGDSWLHLQEYDKAIKDYGLWGSHPTRSETCVCVSETRSRTSEQTGIRQGDPRLRRSHQD